MRSSVYCDLRGDSETKPVNMSIAKKIALFLFLVVGMFGMMSTAQHVCGDLRKVEIFSSCETAFVLLN
jgi:hypothetical protein